MVPPQRRRSDAAAFMQHLARSSIFSLILGANLTLQHSRRRMYAAAHASPHLRCCSRGGALPVEADHSERIFQRRARRLLAGAGAGAGRGGEGRARGVFWGGVGGRFIYVHIPEKGV